MVTRYNNKKKIPNKKTNLRLNRIEQKENQLKQMISRKPIYNSNQAYAKKSRPIRTRNPLMSNALPIGQRVVGNSTAQAAIQARNATVHNVRTALDSAYDSYQRALLVPERAQTARIPGMFPLETNVYHRKFSFVANANATGNLAWVINPYCLFEASSNGSYIFINNDSTLDLLTTGGTKWQASNNFSNLPSGQVSSYRLVSASLIVSPQVNQNTAQGYIAGGITTRSGQTVQAPTTAFPAGVGALAIFGAINTIRNSVDQDMYYQKTSVTTSLSSRWIYMPFDPSFFQFVPINQVRDGLFGNKADEFYWTGYATGLAASTPLNFEINMNFELEPLEEGYFQDIACSHITRSKPEDEIERISQQPALMSQSAYNMNELIDDVDISILTKGKQKPKTQRSWYDNVSSFFEDYGTDILNVTANLAGMLI